jgi:hypothetical protein
MYCAKKKNFFSNLGAPRCEPEPNLSNLNLGVRVRVRQLPAPNLSVQVRVRQNDPEPEPNRTATSLELTGILLISLYESPQKYQHQLIPEPTFNIIEFTELKLPGTTSTLIEHAATNVSSSIPYIRKITHYFIDFIKPV